LGCLAKAEGVTISEPAVHFHPGYEILRTKAASPRRRFEREGSTGSDSIAKFPRFIRQILYEEKILRDIPAFEIAAEDQLEFHLVLDLLSRLRVRSQKVGLHVVPFELFEYFVCSILVFVLHIKDRIDPVLPLEQPEAILPAEGGGDGAVMKSCLRVEIEFCGPPGFRSVLKFKPIRMEVVAAALRTVGREILDLQISGSSRNWS
jgi:hypothetical protein